MKLISFVIPVFNNEESLKTLHQRIQNEMKSFFPHFEYEIIFVNDGSIDNSLQEIKACRELDQSVKIISFSRNFSQISAIIAGMRAAKGDAVINISADLQDPVEQCTKMISEWLNGYEIVICHRESRRDPLITTITSKIAHRLHKQNMAQMPSGGFDFALLDRKAVDAFNSLNGSFRWFQADVLWIGFKKKYLPYTRLKRPFGKSQFTFNKRLKVFIGTSLYISYLPIRLMSIMGFIIAFIGFLYALCITYAYFLHNTPFKGWAPIMICILMIGGLLMIMLGIIGEYIWRIYDEVKNKPHYIIAEQEGI